MIYLPSPKTAFRNPQLLTFRVDTPTVSRSSPVFQRLFLINLFTSVDVAIRDGALYSNIICDRGPPYNQQVKRLRECEKLLVAIELSGMLNDAPLAFQAIVLSYGLIVPMIQNKLPSIPVAQILLRIHAVLTELPANLRIRKQQSSLPVHDRIWSQVRTASSTESAQDAP